MARQRKQAARAGTGWQTRSWLAFTDARPVAGDAATTAPLAGGLEHAPGGRVFGRGKRKDEPGRAFEPGGLPDLPGRGFIWPNRPQDGPTRDDHLDFAPWHAPQAKYLRI